MSTETYIASRGELEGVKNRINRLTNTVATVASCLQSDPGKFIFSNQPIGLPAEATMSARAQTVPAGDWPSVEQIVQLLQEYHRLKTQIQSAWGALTRDEQNSLRGPEDLIPRY